jgi:hypothetical protein
MALSGAIHPLFAADPDSDVAAIQSLLRSAFETPDAPLVVEPVTVGTTHAVAGWRQQQQRGGRALLKQQGASWTIVLCSGEPLTRADGLMEAGVPADEARVLASGIARQEARLDNVARSLLSSFEGTVDMTTHSRPSHHPQHP